MKQDDSELIPYNSTIKFHDWPWKENRGKISKYKLPRLPKISIITPSYNQGHFIEETIRSVLLQNYPNLEYIIIDGGSTDQTLEIIKHYEHYISYWVSEKDNGQAHAINKGLEKATGDIITYINSDDIYRPGSFFKVANYFLKYEFDVIVGKRWRSIKIGDKYWLNHLKDKIRPFISPYLLALTPYQLPQECIFWTKKAAGDKRFNEDLHFVLDADFFFRIFSGAKALHVSDELGFFRPHAESKTSTIKHIQAMEAEKRRNTFGPFMIKNYADHASQLMMDFKKQTLKCMIPNLLARKNKRVFIYHYPDYYNKFLMTI